MRIRTMAGVAVAGAAAAAAIVGGVAYATADESEPTLRIVTERENAAQPAAPEEDCPEKSGGQTTSPSPQGTGL